MSEVGGSEVGGDPAAPPAPPPVAAGASATPMETGGDARPAGSFGVRPELYPERAVPRRDAADRWLARLEALVIPRFATRRAKRLEEILPLVHRASETLTGLDEAELTARMREARQRLRRAERPALADAAEAFAIIREASGRLLGLRHHDVQLMGGYAMISGMIAEMNTGEGKTLTATLAAGVMALTGRPVHVVTVNDYLARRDAEKLGPIYRFLELSVGVVTEGMSPADRRAAYACDVTYCTNKELAFDHLKDRLVLAGMGGNLARKLRLSGARGEEDGGLLLRGLHFAIVDEADSVLVDEARTPLILSAETAASEEVTLMREALAIARQMQEGLDYALLRAERSVRLLPAARERLEDEASRRGGVWRSAVQAEELITQALTALHLMLLDEQYILREGKVAIVDEYSGRVMADRSWSNGLHQMVELKEELEPSPKRTTLARLTYQRFFRRYRLLSGMTGTAAEIAGELWEVYRLRVARIPTHRPSRLRIVPDVVFPDADSRWKGIASIVARLRARGSPVLIGTRSVAASLEASRQLTMAGIPHRVLNAADEAAEAEIVAEAGQPGRVTVATNMAGRGTDIALGPGVEETGGLHVLMSERHDARRVDRQLAGRAGRQGDSGVFFAMLSLDDPILADTTLPFLRPLARWAVARRWSSLASRAMRLAQIRAEWESARIRRRLLISEEEMDNALAFSGTPE